MDRHPLTGREVHLVRYPRGEVRESDFRVVGVDIDDPGPGQVLVRNTWTSVDAAHRLRLREKAPPGYFAAFPLGRAMDGIATVGEVVASRADGFEAGDTVRHAAGWRDYALIEAGRPELGGIGTLMRVDTDAAAPEAYLGALGGSGLTAYVGLFDVAGLREGDVVWVSAAAGSVGSLVAQMAKVRGHRVIGSAGSDDKVSYLLRRARPRRRVQLQGGSPTRAASRRGARRHRRLLRQRRRGSPRGGDRSAAARRSRRPVRRDLRVRRVAPGARSEQPLPRRRERPHPARLPWQQPRRPDWRDDARDRSLDARRTHPLPADRRRRARARPAGPRPSPARRYDRQDGGADRVRSLRSISEGRWRRRPMGWRARRP